MNLELRHDRNASWTRSVLDASRNGVANGLGFIGIVGFGLGFQSKSARIVSVREGASVGVPDPGAKALYSRITFKKISIDFTILQKTPREVVDHEVWPNSLCKLEIILIALCFKTTELAMSKPIMLVCLLVILIVTSQFEWRQPLVDLDAPTTISQKQQKISDREESVKEKIIISQERHIQKLNELVRSLQLQLLQRKGDNGTQNATKSFHSDKHFIEYKRIRDGGTENTYQLIPGTKPRLSHHGQENGDEAEQVATKRAIDDPLSSYQFDPHTPKLNQAPAPHASCGSRHVSKKRTLQSSLDYVKEKLGLTDTGKYQRPTPVIDCNHQTRTAWENRLIEG
ncbi:unnamed protein product [Brassica oleracea var. botrytis]